MTKFIGTGVFQKSVLFISSLLLFSSCKLAVCYAMSTPTVTKLETTKLKRYKVELVKKQGWAGPACYIYVLKKRILFTPIHIKIAEKQVWCATDTVCSLNFTKHSGKLIHVNICSNYAMKHQKKIRSY